MKPILSIECLLCNSPAIVIVLAQEGCTCASNKYQPRCQQHLIKLDDSDDNFFIVEDFRI